MAELGYISSRINQFKEQITDMNKTLSNCYLLVTKEAGGFLPIIDKRYPENQASTLLKVKPGLYQRMNILALRIAGDGKTLELGLAPSTETLSIEDLQAQPKDGSWPLWVPLENGPVIKSVTVLELSKKIWQFIDELMAKKKQEEDSEIVE